MEMELREFVKETLVQLVYGVKDAQFATAESGAVVSPHYGGVHGWAQGKMPYSQTGGGLLQYVEFDVALTSTGSSEKKGGIGVFFGSVGLGGQVRAGAETGAANRIRFSVPVALPVPVASPIPKPG